MDGTQAKAADILAETKPEASQKGSGLAQLRQAGHITDAQRNSLEPVAAQFGVAVTPQMLRQIDPQNPSDPVAAQFVPSLNELDINDKELSDPIGDHHHSPVKGIIHRYPDRVLLTPVHVCPVYCRFCFRREDVGGQDSLSANELEAALNYIRSNTEVWEVILSGGDPLILSPRRLNNILQSLRDIPHVKVIRIHSRVPVVSPEKITDELTAALRAANPLYVVIHTNHAQEFSSTALNACAKLADAGIPLLSQTVLLRGINDTPETLGALMRLLVENRIKPYYLHHADRAKGTGHFRTSIKEGQALMRQMRGDYSGLCQPQYVLDIPGGAGKSPVGPQYIKREGGLWEVTDFNDRTHSYAEERTTGK
ncbi:MAG: lysine-2,3-aminomutase-like protein [Gammaproteobacteria bacterium]|nr:lysine-2,3-aminomutase-like protein [Gammaproteobacteria bacterium]